MSWLTTNFPWFSTGSLLPNLQALLPLLRHQRRLRCTIHRRCVIAGSGHGHQPSAWHETSMEKHLAALQFIGPQQKHISRNESTISKKKRPKNPNIFNFKSKQPQSAVSKSPFVLAPFERLRALKWSGCKKCNANVLSIWCFMNCYTASLIHGMSLSSFSQKFPVKIQRKLLKLFVQSRFRSCFISWNWKQPQNESIPFIVASWIHWRCLGWTHENMCPSNSWELNLPIAREVSPVSWPQIIAPLHLTTILIEWRVDSHSHLHKNQWSMDVPNVLYNQKLVFPHPQFLVEIGRFSTVKSPLRCLHPRYCRCPMAWAQWLAEAHA